MPYLRPTCALLAPLVFHVEISIFHFRTDEENRVTTSGSRRGAHGAAKAIEAVLGVTAGETHPRVGRWARLCIPDFFFRSGLA